MVKPKIRKDLPIFILLLVLILYSCNENNTDVKEGTIIYELEYLTDIDKNPIVSFLPNTMEYSYKKHISMQKIEGWGGIFKIVGIVDNQTDSITGLVKIIGKKMKCTCPIDVNRQNFSSNKHGKVSIKEVEGEKKIAGYTCKKAIAKIHSQEVELYYTDEIDIENGNWNTPYKNVKGLLMEYKIKMFDINILVRAKSVSHEPVNLDDFLVPPNYENTSKDSIFAKLDEYM